MKEKLNKWKKTVCDCLPHFSIFIPPPQAWSEIREQRASAKAPIAPVVKKLSPEGGLRAARVELETSWESLSIELRRKGREQGVGEGEQGRQRWVQTQKVQEIEFPATDFTFLSMARDSESKRVGRFERSGSHSCCGDKA